MDQFEHGSAVDAVVRAGRNSGLSRDAFGTRPDRASPSGQGCQADPHFAALLSRLLIGTNSAAIPCIQFVACGVQNRATAIAFQTAQAATSILGRTLLINARLEPSGPSMTSDLPRAPMPDVFISGLYHHDIAGRPGDVALLYGGGRKAALHALIAPYHFVAIDCPAPSAGPAANALAALCMGSVLVVIAGSCTRDAISDASANLTNAGGAIIGTVLSDAPPQSPRWMGGL